MEIILKDYYLYRSLGKLSDILKGLEKAQEFKRERGSKVGAFQSGLQEVVSNLHAELQLKVPPSYP